MRAAAHATAALDVTGNLSANMITGQVRAIAADLLGAIGREPREARDAVRQARERDGDLAQAVGAYGITIVKPTSSARTACPATVAAPTMPPWSTATFG